MVSFGTLLEDWKKLLTDWASSGALARAANEALLLQAEPEPLKGLISQWSQGNFSDLPPIVLLPASSMAGAAGAYAASTSTSRIGTIYLNQEWLAAASAAQAMAVLTEELGHHLDGLLNAVDTPGDEGELFASLLAGAQLSAAGLLALRTQSDQTQVVVNGQTIEAEASSVTANVIATPIAPASPGRTSGEWRNNGAFAALKADGSVVTWGTGSSGGDSSAVASQLASGVSQIFTTGSAFAAVKADGSVVTWGNSGFGGDSSAVASQLASGASQIFSTASAFAALKADGSVVTWGYGPYGADSSAVASQLASDVRQIFATVAAFAALKADGSVVTWGTGTSGGDSSALASQLTSGVSQIFSTASAFAALKADGSVVTWGTGNSGGDSSAVASQLASGVSQIFSTASAFAALKADGSVVTWGTGSSGGDSSAVASQLASGVSQIFSTQVAFAALKADGSVVTWGTGNSGGDSSVVASQLGSAVSQIFSTGSAFAALKADGSVVTWGYGPYGADSSAVASQLASGVTQIFSTQVAFAALKADGSVVTWGYGPNGADSSAVASQLASGVSQIFSTASAFAALKTDGSVVTWGSGSSGGDSSVVASQLTSGVAGIANPFTNDWLNGGNGTASPITAQNNAAFSEGVTLLACSISNDPDGNGTISGYQWFNNGVAISGATDSSFATTATTFGSYRVHITYQDSKNFIATVSSADQVVAKIDNGTGTVAPFTATGALQEGVTLTAAAVSGDPDGLATNPNYAYQWLLNDAAITGATNSSYSTTATGFGSYSLQQTYTDDQGFTATLTTAAQVIDKIDNGTGTVAPFTATGTLQEGVTLTAAAVSGDPDGLATNPNYAYQWLLNSAAITGATGSSYSTTATGFGSYSLQQTYTDDQGYTATLTTAAQDIAKIDNGTGTVAPFTATGALQEGVTLTAAAVSGDPDGLATNPNYAYQWLLNGAAITGATSPSYSTTATGFGSYRVDITYQDSKNFIATVSSADQVVAKIDNGTGTVAPFTATGALQEGVTLTAAAVSGDPDGLATNPNYNYQWLLNDAAIPGATSSSFTVGAQGAGTYKVAVTYTDGQGYTTTLNSADQVVAKVDNGQGTLSAITGNGAFNEGVTLTAGTITNDPDGNGTPTTFQWFRNGTAIGGALSSIFVVPSGGAGTYNVQVSYSDGQGYAFTLTSAATVVSAPPPLTDTTPPTVVSISTQGTTVILKFSEAVSAQSIPLTAFVVTTVSDSATPVTRAISTLSFDSNDPTRVILTLSGTAPGSSVNLRVSYTDPLNNQTTAVVQDTSGNDLASFSNSFADTFITGSSTTLASQYQGLILTGTGNVNGTGNTLNNSITGNSGHNTLSGGTGADNMAGGLGNDTYVVDDVGDVVTEDLNAGTDTVQSSVTYTLGANVENLTLTGSSAINGTGNALNNVLTGNSAVNNLSGGDGSDTLIGGGGADILTGLAGSDTFRFALADSRLAAFDRITDFAIGTDILDGHTAVSAANLKELGSVNALTATAIGTVLTTTNFAKNGAATFSLGLGPTTRTFLAINDGTAGFSSTSDGFIEITGYSGLLTNLAIA